MSTPATGGLRRRFLPQWSSQQQGNSQNVSIDRAVGQAAPPGAALSLHAAHEGTAVGNCDDQRAIQAAGRIAFRATQSARRAATVQAIQPAPQVRPSGGLRHRIIKTQVRAGSGAITGNSRSLVSKKATVPPALKKAPGPAKSTAKFLQGREKGGVTERQISVSTNLPDKVPVMPNEIALVGSALAEFLRSTATANDNGSQE